MRPYSLRLIEDAEGRRAEVWFQWGEVCRLCRWAPDGAILPAFEDDAPLLRLLTSAQLAEIRVLAGVWLPPL